MKPYSPSDKLVVRDSLLDEELSDDVEDDVFIRDGRTCKTYEDKNLKRPLMAPRKKYSRKSSKNSLQLLLNHPNYKKSKCWRCWEPFCYGLGAILVLTALICLTALLLTLFPISLQKFKLWFHNYNNNSLYDNLLTNSDNVMLDKNSNLELVPCTNIQITKVWSTVLPRLNSETPVRKADLNSDGIEDVVVGFGVDDNVELRDIPQCSSGKLGITDVCGGGISALDGQTGKTLWQYWTLYTVFSIFCKTDINRDGVPDCIAAGRGALLIAIDGKTGKFLWEIQEAPTYSRYNSDDLSTMMIDLYTVNILPDLDDDGVNDIVAVHTDEKENVKEGHIKLISGINGKVIASIPTPYNEEIFVPAQMTVQDDGSRFLLIITGGQNSPGGVYKILLNSVIRFKNDNDFIPIIRNNSSGFLVPAILTDINEDSVDDIIICAFNSTVYAFNGKTNQIIWTYAFLSSETVSEIVPGHYNHDNVTDFMIKFNTGPGFPIYYYSQTTILNGVTGQSFLDNKMTDSGGSHSLLGGLSISQSFGGDFFLHWQLQCRDKYDAKDPYTFIPDSDIIQQSRADLCMLRYNTSTVLKLNAITRHVEPPGAVIFSSDDLQLQLNQTDKFKMTLKQTVQQALKHPKLSLNKIQQQQIQTQTQQQQLQNQQQQLQNQQQQSNLPVKVQQPIEVNKKQIPVQVQVQEPRQISNMQQVNPMPQQNLQPQFQQQIPQIQMQQPSIQQQQQIPIKQFQKPIQKQNFPQELNGNQQNNQNAIIMNKKIENTIDRNANAFNNQNQVGIKPKQKSAFQQREKQLAENMETRREKIMNHGPRKGYNKNFNAENTENIDDFLNINKMALLDDLQEIQNEQDNGDFMRIAENGLGNLPIEEKPNDYDMYYNDDQVSPGKFMQSMRQYPPMNNRGIRSDDYDSGIPAPSTYETILNDLEKSEQADLKSKSVKKVLDDSDVKATQPQMEPRQETLWDIEIEKEAKENSNFNHKPASKREISTNMDSTIPLNQNVLPSIASTGVLLESLNSINKSTIDLVFVLNLRESEIFPPLLLPSDIDCIEDRMNVARMNAGQSYRGDNEMLMLQKTFLKECLKNRLANIPIDSFQQKPNYETQIIITRISISCTCSDNLNPKHELCSTLNSINQQKWTEFMGSNLNGIY